MDLLRFSTAGSVDDGKSTLIGRLLYETRAVFVDQLDAVRRLSGKSADGDGPPELPALTICVGDRQVAHYLALPEGPEAPPVPAWLLVRETSEPSVCAHESTHGTP